jgi:hypothetical protein
VTDPIGRKTPVRTFWTGRKKAGALAPAADHTDVIGQPLQQLLIASSSEDRPLLLARHLTTQVLSERFRLNDQMSADYQRLHREISLQMAQSDELQRLLATLVPSERQ